MIAANPERALFVCETRDGVCALFVQLDGPIVQTGDILEGAVSGRGAQTLGHVEGLCSVFGESGPLTRDEAMARAREAGNEA